MIDSALIEAMANAGVTAQQIAQIAKEYSVASETNRALKREQNRIRQQRHRERNAMSRVTDVTSRDTLSPKEKSPTPPKEITPIPLHCEARAIDQRIPELLSALGITDETRTPGLLVISDPIRWVEGGCDIDMDIIPALRSIRAKGRAVRSWAYCTDAVFEARDRRLAPAPEARQFAGAGPPPNRKPRNAGESARLELIRMQENGNAPLITDRHDNARDRNSGFAGTDIARRIAIASGG